jgi:hypothetical protein
MKSPKSSRSRVAQTESSLCQFPYADGRQCRMLRQKSHPSLCPFHAREDRQQRNLDRISKELSSLSGEFTTASDINHVIGRLFKLVAADRIPLRNAQLLAYLAQLLLFSQPALKYEQNIAHGFLGWADIVRKIYVQAGLAQPAQAQTPPPEAQALLAEGERV